MCLGRYTDVSRPDAHTQTRAFLPSTLILPTTSIMHQHSLLTFLGSSLFVWRYMDGGNDCAFKLMTVNFVHICRLTNLRRNCIVYQNIKTLKFQKCACHGFQTVRMLAFTVIICGNKMPNRCNRGFYCRSYCLLNMFRASLCPSSGAQEYYTVVAACGISCCGFQVGGLVWS